ncbi:hypothetical protein GCM10018954_030910 [Kutzneria kofuensis]
MLGRLATQAATLLRGKHKPTYAPHVDTGDFVVIVNAEKVALTGNKRDQAFVYRHSGHPGGLSKRSFGEMLEKQPERLVGAGDQGHAAAHAGSVGHGQQAQGVRRPGAPARGAAAAAVRDHQDRPVTEEVSVTTPDHEPEQLADEAVAAEAADHRGCRDRRRRRRVRRGRRGRHRDRGRSGARPGRAAQPPDPDRRRRKEAIVRVRLVPGTGKFTLNGKSLEQYFPNKVHQQLIKEPLVTVERTEMFDVIGNLVGGGISGQAGALRLAIARALIEFESEDRRR